MLNRLRALQKKLLALDLQKILFGSFTIVAMVPVVFLGTWIQRNAFEVEIQAVREKHLLLAKNISGALSRYALDLTVTFTEKSENYQAPLSVQEKRLLSAFNIRMLAVIADQGPIFKMGGAVDLPSGGVAALAQERGEAFRRLHAVTVSPIIMNTRNEPLIYICRVTQMVRWCSLP